MPLKTSEFSLETEVLSSSDDQTLARKFNKHVIDELLKERGSKYRVFLGIIYSIGTVSQLFREHARERQELLKTIYTVMRYIDDIVDGDRALPASYQSSAECVEDLLEFIKKDRPDSNDPQENALKRLLAYCNKLGASFGANFTREAEYLLSSLLFDARRKGTMTFPSEEQIQTYHRDRDIRGTVAACLKICNEDPHHEEALAPLGQATQIGYDLRDFQDDVRAGFNNIPLEDAQRLGITIADLHGGISSPKVRLWCLEQTAVGMQLLRGHRKIIENLPVGKWTKLMLFLGYESPTRKLLNRELEKMDGTRVQSKTRTFLQSPLKQTFVGAYGKILSNRHATELQIRPEEATIYHAKTRHLSLYYSDFTKGSSIDALRGATQAAFLSCAYDVVTDWHNFDAAGKDLFEQLMQQYQLAPEARAIAMNLYEKDKQNQLENDGLERGAAALEFTVILMGIRQEFHRREINIVETGEVLQIVDDILDYEEDMAKRETNCLATPRKQDHLERFLASDLLTHFDYRTPLGQAIVQSRLKARLLLKTGEMKIPVREG